MRLITVCDFRYAREAQRLVVSLDKSGSRAPLIIFCDEPAPFASLRHAGKCEVRVLPEIGTLGAKRAKFTAYVRALAEFGDVLYLDSDIIALSDLGHLHAPGRLRACPDDLSACDFITDRDHPWPGDPGLANRGYINSGLLHLPAALLPFFERLRSLSLDEEAWTRHIFPGKLYDNHFLCAQLNRENIPVDPLDGEEYNWQGFFRAGELQVRRSGNTLVNRVSGRPLRLVHFAGVRDVDQALCGLPVDVAALLCERSTEAVASPQSEFTRFQASFSDSLHQPPRDPFVMTVYEKLRRELLALSDGGWSQSFGNSESYFRDPDSLLSLVYSRPSSRSTWNGLQCGGAYLEGDEYNYLAQLVSAFGIRTIVETGAGETSICFQAKGARPLALEAAPGPWLDRARAAGCRAIHVPFDGERCEFEPSPLAGALSGMTDVDLIFIDSPIGTRNRSRVLTQLMRTLRPSWVLFHDAHRDAPNLYRYQLEHDLRLADYLSSRRGMVLFAVGAQRSGAVPRISDDLALSAASADWSVTAGEPLPPVEAGEQFVLNIVVANRGPEVLSSRYRHPVHASYHWRNERGEIVLFDGLRTPLPFDLYPGDSAGFELAVAAPETPGRFSLQVALVQEMITWFDGAALTFSLPVEVAARDSLS